MFEDAPIFFSNAFLRRMAREKEKQAAAERRAQELAQEKTARELAKAEKAQEKTAQQMWDEMPDPPSRNPDMEDPHNGSYILNELVGAVEGYVDSGGEVPAFFYLDEEGKIWLTPDGGGGSSLCGWQAYRDGDSIKLRAGQYRVNFGSGSVYPTDEDIPSSGSLYLNCDDSENVTVSDSPDSSPGSQYVKLIDVTSDGRIIHYALGQTVDFVLTSDC